MARKITRWFLSLQMTLYLFLIFVRGNEDADNAYRNGRNLVLEYFLPINLPAAVDVPLRREKRDVEGSGEDESVFSELKEKGVEDADNSTQSSFAKLILQESEEQHAESAADSEGSGEVDEVSESSDISSEEKSDAPLVSLIPEREVLTTTLSDEVFETTKIPENRSEVFETTKIPENRSEVLNEVSLTSTEMIFDKSEDFDEIVTSTTGSTTNSVPKPTPTVILINTTMDFKEEMKTTTAGSSLEETTAQPVESRLNESMTPPFQETTTVMLQTTTHTEETTTALPAEATTVFTSVDVLESNAHTTDKIETTTSPPTTKALPEEKITIFTPEPPILIPILTPQRNASEEGTTPEIRYFTTPQTNFGTNPPSAVPSTSKFITPPVVSHTTESLPAPTKPSPSSTPKPVIEEVFKETKIDKKEEAMPGNILQKENLSLAADPLLIANTRLMDSEENVQLSSSEPKRLGAYIVIGLILLSFSSLVGYITFKKRMNRKRLEFESNQESNDTEKALLSLSDYKDNSELEENHLKNNEITPIVVKSNSQINKFEKNTNFSSPKNLNTIANEKNIEKDNVLKSTAENLTQVIIEDSPKDVEEDKNVPSMEKFIVKTRIDQDSIPKKPIIINRSSAGYLPIPQDNS